MKKVFKVTLLVLGIIVVLIAAAGFYVKEALPDVGPPPDLHVKITPERVDRGRYLSANVAGCIVCHSSRDTNRFAGPPKPGSFGKGGDLFGHDDGLPGDVYAPNLTPYHLRNWTDGELFRAITCGVSKDGHALFPLMNYPAFGRLDSEDIYSIIAYLRTLPPIPNDVPATRLDFPLSLLVNTFPAKADLSPKPDSSNSILYGKYLVTMASCVDCHSPVERGRVVKGMEFAGGREFRLAAGGALFSPNLTPDKETGLGSWTREMFIRQFKQYADSASISRPSGTVGMGTPMPWTAFAGMKESDLGDIYDYLHSLKPIHHRNPR
ncbi:MAG TPA: c-type cytochrome [Puia sp.]|nr:c-type cytochrome [Puia sp.]